jgi:hypothetical protein
MSTKSLIVGGVVAVIGGVVATALFVAAADAPPNATYVGPDTCKACHLPQFKTWQAHKHSKNFQVLEGGEQKNPECIKCHTTGYGKPSGFVSIEKTPNLANTGCEDCHGPGSAHLEAAKAAPETGAWEKKISRIIASACIGCHNPHNNQKDNAAKLRAAGKSGK